MSLYPKSRKPPYFPEPHLAWLIQEKVQLSSQRNHQSRKRLLSYKGSYKLLFPSLLDQSSPSYIHLANKFRLISASYAPPFRTVKRTPASLIAVLAAVRFSDSPDKTTTKAPTGVWSKISIFPYKILAVT